MAGVGSWAGAADLRVDFDRDVRPIFASRCFECHGAKKQKGGLNLENKAAALSPADSGQPAIVPGRSADSLLLRRVSSQDPDEAMPPKGDRLTADQIASIKAWIDQGAVWPDAAGAVEKPHWAYVKPQRPAQPAVRNAAWPRNAIDTFVLARLEAEGLSPAPEAERATWIRRVSLDVIGLPPTLDEVDAFRADESPDAYERVVDRLLASPHYGERWARPWLDLARYADTQGYEKDERRNIWPYRDWVIQALNRDLPFDQFTLDQLAGDLQPNPTREQKVATGLHRNTLTNTEGGTDDEEFRHEAVVDRVNTTMTLWMGSTLGCAQCHNHKYDPFTMKDYYGLFAFFNSTADHDQPDERPTLKLPTPEQEQRLRDLDTRLAAADREYQAQTPALAEARARWERATWSALHQWTVLEPVAFASAGGATLVPQTDHSLLATGANPSNDVYTVTFRLAGKELTGLRLEVLPDASLPHRSLGRHPNGSFVLNRFEAALATDANPAERRPLAFERAAADFTQEGHSVTNLIDGQPGAGWAVSAGDAAQRVARAAVFGLRKPWAVEESALLTVTLRHTSRWPEANVGRFRLAATTHASPSLPPNLPPKAREILALAPDRRTDKQTAELDQQFRAEALELRPVRELLARLRKEREELDRAIPTTPILVELEKPRQTHIHLRGGFLSKGEQVEPDVPVALPRLTTPEGHRPTRLDFARWLVSEENPLTSRVTVNRLWEQYFGIGLVETSEDFGTQGEPPSHAQLLDWLATEFQRRGWSQKALHKLIVLSATYRQSSRVTPALLQRDPYNRLLARGPRVRLEAEMLRDQALAVSGLLSRKIGGPSVFPPQPEGLWQVVYSGDNWKTSPGEDKYRRGLYTFWRRTMPHPALTTFDAPSREFCVVRRTRSNTPLQSLVLLNDPVFVEAAQALARRLVAEGGAAAEDRAAYALRLCLARQPQPAEVERLVALYRQERARFEADTTAAGRMAASELGQPGDAADLKELAAWTVVANVLLNLDELITKG
jgi:hypothetical protein